MWDNTSQTGEDQPIKPRLICFWMTSLDICIHWMIRAILPRLPWTACISWVCLLWPCVTVILCGICPPRSHGETRKASMRIKTPLIITSLWIWMEPRPSYPCGWQGDRSYRGRGRTRSRTPGQWREPAAAAAVEPRPVWGRQQQRNGGAATHNRFDGITSYFNQLKLLTISILDPESNFLPVAIKDNWLDLNESYRLARHFCYNVHKKREKMTKIIDEEKNLASKNVA